MAAADTTGAGTVLPLQAYQRHITSDFLADRYPYLEDIRGHLKEDDVSMAFGDRLFPRLVEQLKSPTIAPEKLIEALRTVVDLCANQENKSQAIASDVVAAATDLLMHDHVPVRREAARVITSMALMIGGRSLMPVGSANLTQRFTSAMASGATMPRLAKLLLSCNDQLVKMHVAEALRSVTQFRDGCQQVVDHETVKAVAQYLCATLPNLPPTVELAQCLLHLLYTLGAVTMYAKDGMRDLFGVGLIAKIVGFLGHLPKDHAQNPLSPEAATDTLRQALRVLWHTGNDPRGRLEAHGADGVRVVTNYLKHTDPKVREAAVCALNVASLETQGKKDVLRYSIGGLGELLHNDKETPYLHETSIQLCRCASELPAFRFSFARLNLRSIWLLEKIYGTPSLAAVSPLLNPRENLETRIEAAKVVRHFLRPPSIEGDKIRVPPICPLRHIENPPLFAIEECADILSNLAALMQDAPEEALDCFEALVEADKPREELQAFLESGRAQISEANRERVEAIWQKDPEASEQSDLQDFRDWQSTSPAP
mmetsp:Transcript_126490/g.252733  ORF Transcript_126490/g.252733 Transcript_126490/m.252733 type:complete len:541 (-) Transcript_126490:9-1631(-)|eukprot:CAMPEP_0172691720 /NCGR_PEP_ID=MMETSP1074-20121228/24748_1 /TAXON_ID=2916 /ORGANISM="Ceratium fusus, Strain PA161109" /LENGTH=540 /DNA_ID=CAMNT_0013511819 /DNA_START=98 /DNA_END=1720 /DNA_ORIENTATION=-